MVERLREAIAQARAAREIHNGRDLRPRLGARATLHLRSGAAGAAWQALTQWAPAPRLLETARIVTTQRRAEASAFDLLRTKILQQMRANGWKRIMITSPSAGCGKSTVALNLAFSLSRQEELFTLLLGADLRKPSIVQRLQFEAEPQFSEVLAGRSEFVDHACRFGTNLAIAANSEPVENPSELLQSQGAAQALDRIDALYQPDLTIFDTAPVLVSDDTLALASRVDCALIIAATEETTVKEIDICERELAERTNVLGVVVNKFRYGGHEAGYGYGYGYGHVDEPAS